MKELVTLAVILRNGLIDIAHIAWKEFGMWCVWVPLALLVHPVESHLFFFGPRMVYKMFPELREKG